MPDKILFVSPNDADRQWFEAIVYRHVPKGGVVAATAAEEGFVLAGERHFVCAVVFETLPDMRGVDLCRRLRDNNSTTNLPVLLYTYDTLETGLLVDALDAGAVDAVAVPCPEEELAARLRVMMRMRRMEQRLQHSNAKLLEVAGTRSRELYCAEERSRFLLNNSRDGFFVVACDKEGIPRRYVQANAVICQWLGYTEQEFLALPIEALVGEDRIGVILPRVRAIREYKKMVFTGVFRHKNGGEIPFDFHVLHQDTRECFELLFMVRPCKGGAETTDGVSGVPQVGHVVFEYHLDTGALELYGTVKQMLGASPEELAGLNWLERRAQVHPEDWAALDAVYGSALSGVGSYTTRYRMLCPDGAYRLVEEQGFVLPDAEGEAECVMGALLDAEVHVPDTAADTPVTAEPDSERMESLGVLAGGIAHDFNNILAAIIGLAELSLRRVAKLPEVQENLKGVLQSAQRGRELTAQILTFARQDGGESAPLYVHTLAREVMKLMRGNIPRNIKLVDRIDRKSGPILTNPGQLQQAILKSCLCMMRALGGEAGRITLEVRDVGVTGADAVTDKHLHEGDYVCFGVLGEGEGVSMPTESKELAQVRRIVHAAGGALLLEGGDGAGAAMRLYFPRIGYQELYEGEMAEAGDQLNGRILFVDDEALILRFGGIALKRVGFEVECVASPLEALKVFEGTPGEFAMVITDQIMPKMTGVELAAAIREIDPSVPVILCTGYSEELTEEDILRAGIQEVLLKPMTSADLSKAVRRVLGQMRGGLHSGK